MDSRLRKIYFPEGGHGKMTEVRIFDDASIQASVSDALRSIHPSRNGAVLKVRMKDGGVAAVMASRLNDNWSMGLVLDKPKHGPLDVGAQVVFEW